jgi:hypothetical protein
MVVSPVPEIDEFVPFDFVVEVAAPPAPTVIV